MDTIVLFSGGMDSSIVLALALESGRKPLALSFDYGQRHVVELEAAKKIAHHFGVPHKIHQLDLHYLTSPLLGDGEVVKGRSKEEREKKQLSPTYVPMRNTLFLAYAASLAEQENASEVHFGPNFHDRTGFPDTTPAYTQAFDHMLREASEGKIRLITPIQNLSKQQIFQEGKRLGVPLDLTHSCYDPTPAGKACGECDACLLVRSFRD